MFLSRVFKQFHLQSCALPVPSHYECQDEDLLHSKVFLVELRDLLKCSAYLDIWQKCRGRLIQSVPRFEITMHCP